MKKLMTAAVIAAAMLSLTACGCSASTDMESNLNTPSSSISPDNTQMSGNSYSGSVRTGLGIVADTSGSTAAAADTEGSASFNFTACALVIDEDGNIIDVRFDSVETGLGFDYTGAFTGDIGADISTKRELGDDYGLGAVSSIGANWHEQTDALEDWLRGKSFSDAMSMQLSYDGDRRIPDEEDLRTSVTISVGEHLDALEKAYDDAMGNTSGSGMSGDSGSSFTDGASSGDDLSDGTGSTAGDVGGESSEPNSEQSSSQ